MEAIGEFIDHYGLPIVVLGAVAFAAWRFCRWIRPLATQILVSAKELVDSLKFTTEANAEANTINAKANEKNADALSGIRESVAEIAGKITPNGCKWEKDPPGS